MCVCDKIMKNGHTEISGTEDLERLRVGTLRAKGSAENAGAMTKRDDKGLNILTT